MFSFSCECSSTYLCIYCQIGNVSLFAQCHYSCLWILCRFDQVFWGLYYFILLFGITWEVKVNALCESKLLKYQEGECMLSYCRSFLDLRAFHCLFVLVWDYIHFNTSSKILPTLMHICPAQVHCMCVCSTPPNCILVSVGVWHSLLQWTAKLWIISRWFPVNYPQIPLHSSKLTKSNKQLRIP